MARSSVKLNSRELQSYLDGDHGVAALLDEKAQAVLAAAQADAQGYVVTGNYLASLQVVTDHTDRMVKRITATAPHAHLVEASHGTLARALDAAL